jgi:hypothetical protein
MLLRHQQGREREIYICREKTCIKKVSITTSKMTTPKNIHKRQYKQLFLNGIRYIALNNTFPIPNALSIWSSTPRISGRLGVAKCGM